MSRDTFVCVFVAATYWKPGRLTRMPSGVGIMLRHRRRAVWYSGRSVREYRDGESSPPAKLACRIRRMSAPHPDELALRKLVRLVAQEGRPRRPRDGRGIARPGLLGEPRLLRQRHGELGGEAPSHRIHEVRRPLRRRAVLEGVDQVGVLLVGQDDALGRGDRLVFPVEGNPRIGGVLARPAPDVTRLETVRRPRVD